MSEAALEAISAQVLLVLATRACRPARFHEKSAANPGAQLRASRPPRFSFRGKSWSASACEGAKESLRARRRLADLPLIWTSATPAASPFS